MTVVVCALLALAAPARAGGWAVITLDALPQAVRAGEAFQVGFVIRQHGETPVSQDWTGHPLSPTLRAKRQGSTQTLSFAARQSGRVGHFVVDITRPSDGVWEWSIAAPPFYLQTTSSGDGEAASLEPLTVLPAATVAAPTTAPAQPVASNALPAQPEVTSSALIRRALSGAGVLLLVVAAGLAWTARRQRQRNVARWNAAR
jgi:hypothetical protein